jgi:hypothetical protein
MKNTEYEKDIFSWYYRIGKWSNHRVGGNKIGIKSNYIKPKIKQ